MNLLTTLGLLALTIITPAKAASFAFGFSPDKVTHVEDPYYQELYTKNGISADNTSRIFTSTATYDGTQPDSPTPGLKASMSGRYYDSDPARGNEWGLLDAQSPEFTERPVDFSGYVIKYGVRPSAIGSQVSTLKDANGDLAKASYIEFKLSSDDTVLFESLTVTIDELVAIEKTDVAWAGTSKDNFESAIAPNITRNTESKTISFHWDDLFVVAGDMDVRVYGIKGSDYGNFSGGRLEGIIKPPPPVPEASTGLLSLLACLGIFGRRKR